MATIDRVKKALGISHTAMDAEYTSLIASGKAELIRLGVPNSVATGTDPLVEEAVIAYVCDKRTIGAPEHETWHEQWIYSSDCLRKHVWPEGEPDEEPGSSPEN